MCMYVGTFANMQQHCVRVCVSVCVSLCLFSACMCVWQCYVVGRQEGCTLCGLTNTGFSNFKVYRF